MPYIRQKENTQKKYPKKRSEKAVYLDNVSNIESRTGHNKKINKPIFNNFIFLVENDLNKLINKIGKLNIGVKKA